MFNIILEKYISMRFKHIILLFVFSVVAGAAFGQKDRITQFTQSNLPAEMQAYLDQATSDKEKKADNAKLIGVFAAQYGRLGADMQGRVTAICNTVLKLKVRQHPDVYNFISVFNKMAADGGEANFGQWIASIEYIQSRNKKVKDFTDFIEFTASFVTSRTLYTSRSCTWQMQSGCAYRLLFEGNEIKIVVDKPIELYYSSDKDNGTIYGTKGVYHYFDNLWKGQGGRLNWDRTGIPTTQCWANLNRYEAVTKFPKFNADSVEFTNTSYFSKPIYGRVEEALSAKMEPEKYSFPKFRSYQKDFKMKDILPGVDYSGSFMMNGSRFITSDTKNPATLIFYRQGRPFITVNSVKFTITSPTSASARPT